MDYRLELLKKRFVTIDGLFSSDELRELEFELDALVYQKNHALSHVDINRPSKKSNFILNSNIFKKCQILAEDFFHEKCHCLYDHAIYKFAFCNTPTLWHQDQAYLGSGIPISSLNFWVPLQDTNEKNGGLLFAKNSPIHLVPHEKIISCGVEQLATKFSDEYCCQSVKKGSVSVHDSLTLHASSPNSTSSVRKAWIVHFSPTTPLVKRFYQVKAKIFK